jgi:hypothetical protein
VVYGSGCSCAAWLALAEDSPQRLEASMDEGRVLVATDDGQIVAYL